MGICASVTSDRKKRNRDVTANKFPNKISSSINNNEISSTRPRNNNQSEKIIGKIDDQDLKRNNTVTSNFNQKSSNNSNIQKSQTPSLIVENIIKEKNQISFHEKKSQNEYKEKKDKIGEQNVPSSKEENTIASLKMEEEIKNNNNNSNKDNNNNNDNNNIPEQSDKSINNVSEKKKESEKELQKIDENIKNNSKIEEIKEKVEKEKIKEEKIEVEKEEKKEIIKEVKKQVEKVVKKELVKEENKMLKKEEEKEEKKEAAKEREKEYEDKKSLRISDTNNNNEKANKNAENNFKNNNKNKKININNKNMIKEDTNNMYEEDSFITFFKDFNKSNIYDNSREISRRVSYSNINRPSTNNNYYLFKGNLFNMNTSFDSSEESNELNANLDSNKIKDGLYYFSEFHFTQKRNYSTEKDFNNLLNSQIFQNKIILTNKLLNLQERQWYKESINLSDSLKINRVNTYLEANSFNLYLRKIINLYNHFNWLTWAVSYYYFNSLLFNKNHWFNSKNNNLPSYDNLDWIKGFEWKGIYIKVMTYQQSKKIRNEIKALKYAFLDYINIIDTFKNKSGNNNLLSNEIIFPFITYSYFGGIVIYFSVAIKKFYYSEENSMFFEISKDNSNTKSNTKSFENKEKQFDEISEITILDYKKLTSKNKNFLNFNDDHINLNENVINNDINISKYSKVDLENSKILGKITENNLIKIIDDLDDTSNINYEKYKFMLTNIYTLLPNLFKETELAENNSINLNYIKYKNNYNYPRLYELIESDFKDNEINTLNNLLEEQINENNINIYQNTFNGINYRIIYQNNHDIKNEKVTNYFVKFPFIQNRELSNKIINQYLKNKNINFLMHKFQQNHKQEISDNNVILYKINLQQKMKYTLITKDNDNLTIENFHALLDNLSNNIASFKTEMRNVDNLLNFCEKNGLNLIFLPFLASKIKNENIVNLIKIYLFSKIIKEFFTYYQGQNFLLKLSIYEASKDKDILNSTDSSIRDNNMIELERALLVNIIKFFLLPNEFTNTVFCEKQNFVSTFMENLPFFVFLHFLKIKKFEKILYLSTFYSKLSIKELIKQYALICRNNPFLFIDTLEKLINFRMNPYLKYRASLDVQNLKELKKEEIIIFAPKITTFIDFSDIAGYIFTKSVLNSNTINSSISNNLLLSISNFNITTKIGRVDSCMINRLNSKKNNNNITRRFPEDNDDENITIVNNGIEDLSWSHFQQINNNGDTKFKNKLINNNNNLVNQSEKPQKLNIKAILNDIILDNFLPSKISKININLLSSNNPLLFFSIPNEEILVEYNSNIENIFGEVISYNGSSELIIFKIYLLQILKQIFFLKNLKQAKELLNKLKEKFEKQYLFTFNQCAVLSFLESLTYDKYLDSFTYYTKSLIFALFNLGEVRCNNCNGHQFLLLPIYILCKITGYLNDSDTNEYFKEMFRCLNFKINKFLKTKNIDEKLKKLIYYSFPSVSDLKLKNNEFLYDRNFVIFLINSLLSFFYSGDRLLIDNDFLSYYKINFKISKNEDEDKLSDKNSNLSSINQSPYIIDILLDKMSFLKYAPSDILVSFGANKLNQTSHDNYDMLTLPRLVYKLSDLKIKKIFSGHNYNFVIDNKNEVYSWGDNSRGQCGHCDKIVIKSPKQVFFPELCENDYIENICCGKNCTYFISFNKKIFLCGYNLIINKIWYNPTLLELNFDSNISQIKSGDDFTLFLTEKGNLYSMGFGSHGQLGISNLITEYNNKKYCQKPTKILNSIKSISCGAYYAFAISYNSEIFCWGDNSQGQLGLNNKSYNGNNMINYEQDKNNILTPEKLDGLEEFEIKNIQCGKNFTFFQKKNNDLLGCGDNSKEQLGISMNTNINNEIYIPTEIEQFSFLVVNRISCGDEHSMAIIKDNTSDLVNIWCWGSNEYGQLGLGCHVMNSKPKPNHYLLEFINHKPIDISTGSFHTIILLQRKDFNPNNNDETLIKLIFDNSKI